MHKIIKFNEIDSTNLYLKRNYQDLLDGTVVVSNHQTNGKGRMDRIWSDDDDLLFSILIKNNIEKLSNPFLLSLLMASVMYHFTKKYTSNVTIKWPNDILVNNKKIAGILLESICSDKLECLIIGVGLNVNTTQYSNDLLIKATSLKLETNNQYDKSIILKEIIEIFDIEYQLFIKGKKNYIKTCINNSYLTGKIVKMIINNKLKTVKVLNILENGNILILVDGIEKEFNSGEILLKDIYK